MKKLPINAFSGTIQNQSTQLINARDLHQFLQVGRDFSNWIKARISDYNFSENEDYTCSPNLASSENQGFSRLWGGQNKIEYHLTLDMAKELCMLERSELGQQARRYFIQMEKQARELAEKERLETPAFIRQGKLPELLNGITIEKDRYIQLLEMENSQLKNNQGKPQHPRKGLRLNNAERAEIYQLRSQGLSQASIARQVNRSETAVRDTLKLAMA